MHNGRTTYYVPAIDPTSDKFVEENDSEFGFHTWERDDTARANCMSSWTGDGEGYDDPDATHLPCVDVDRELTEVDHRVLTREFLVYTVTPSSTPGHYHITSPYPTEWWDYRETLDNLLDAGIIEEGYHNASIARNATSLRLPWVRK